MIIRHRPLIPGSQITAPTVYRNRRRLMSAAAFLPVAAALPAAAEHTDPIPLPHDKNPDFASDKWGLEEFFTPQKKVLAYNNFYELGPAKDEPADNDDLYSPTPWAVEVSGEVLSPQTFSVDELAKLAPMEERVYRLRCVEAWSMVIPWLGFPLSALINKVQPTGNAKFLEFVTFNPEELFPDDANGSLPWPYLEGLRMDEAMNPLTLLTFGLFGETLPTQNGAPIRVIIPWKYGFKSGKALVKIRFVEAQPVNTWNRLQSSEYGFYANVNPQVSHPRWSQSSERAISDSFLPSRRQTDMFNGYGEQVAHLYADMDLRKNF